MNTVIESIEVLNTFFDKFGKIRPIIISVIDIAVILFLVKVFSVIIVRIIERAFEHHAQKHGRDGKFMTLKKISVYTVRFVIYFIGAVAVLDVLGLGKTVSSLLATAGIGGVAIGFGAQSLVKDVITGTFILMENRIAIGDYVKIADVTGTIEDITLCTVKLRDFDGEQHIVPNGQIAVVTNYSRGNTRAVVDMPFPYEEDVKRVYDILTQAMEKIADKDCFAEKPYVFGIVEFADSAVVMRLIGQCHAMRHFEGAEIMRRAAFEEFNKNNISVPYNKIEILGDISKRN